MSLIHKTFSGGHVGIDRASASSLENRTPHGGCLKFDVPSNITIRIVLLLLAFCGFVAHAQDFTYTTNKGRLKITGYSGSGHMSIPASINGLPVVDIADGAFYNRTDLTGVEIPDTVTNLGSYAFYHCTGVTNLKISESLTTIPEYAFYFCSSLRNVTIPNSVTNIQSYSFSVCRSLTNLIVPDSVLNIGGSAFSSCSSLAEVTFPAHLTSLASYVVAGCTSLTAFTVPTNVTVIGNWSFSNSGLRSITLPDSVNVVQSCAFSSCAGLTNVILGKNVKNIGTQAFFQCANLSGINFPTMVTNVGGEAFAFCSSLKTIFLPSSLTQLGVNVFSRCSNLEEILVDSQNPVYEAIGGVLFDKSHTILVQFPPGRTGTYSVPSGVRQIAACAFYSGRLTNVLLPPSLDSLRDAAFGYCPNLTGAYFSGGVPNISTYDIFVENPNVTVYYLPGTFGWESTFDAVSTAVWLPEILTDSSFKPSADGFGFDIFWAESREIVVQVADNLGSGGWIPVATNVLAENVFHFVDPTWTDAALRFYRVKAN